MIKKILFAIIVTILSLNIVNSQNFLKSLYELDQFPNEMKKSKEFIDKICSDLLIYKYITGGHNSQQFDIRSKNNLKIKLPFKENFYIDFFNKKTNKYFKDYTFHTYYDFKYLKYYDEFKVTDSTFSLSSIFDLATRYYSFDEYKLVNEIIINYDVEIKYDKIKRLDFFNKLSKALKLEIIPDFNTVLNDPKIDNYTHDDIQEAMLGLILEEIDYETKKFNDLIFNFFILDSESNINTKKNIIRIFNNDNIINEIETEVLQPKISISLNQGGNFNIPSKYFSVNNSKINALQINLIEVKIDFKNNKILIDFTNKESSSLKIKEPFPATSKIKESNINIKKTRLEISDISSKFIIFQYIPVKHLEKEFYEINLNSK